MTSQLPFTGERIVPGKTPTYLIWAHTSRYHELRDAVEGKSVLDAGCGEGYGTFYLAQYASQAVGVDLSPEAVSHARHRYVRPNLSFGAMDGSILAFADASFDVVCSFEVIEHLPAPGRFLEEVRRVLKPAGAFYVSTPNGGINTGKGLNPYHEQEWTLDEFRSILGGYFPSVEIYGQFCQHPIREALFMRSTNLYLRSGAYRRLIDGLAPLYFRAEGQDAPSDDPAWVARANQDTFVFSQDAPERATYFLAVCRKAEQVPGSSRHTEPAYAGAW